MKAISFQVLVVAYAASRLARGETDQGTRLSWTQQLDTHSTEHAFMGRAIAAPLLLDVERRGHKLTGSGGANNIHILIPRCALSLIRCGGFHAVIL